MDSRRRSLGLATALLGGLALAACVSHRGIAKGPLKSDRETPRGPNSWFMNQRRSAGDGTIPVRARARAIEEFQALESASAAPGSWVNVGPLNVGGRVTALGVDPNNPFRLWLGAAAGGVFRSDDAGTNWTPVFDGQTALSIGSIAVHPTISGIVYVGTGEDNGGGFSYDGEGVFKTTDGGNTWTYKGLAETRRIGKIVIDPVSPERVFVAAGGDWFKKDVHRGIYRSLDGGDTWQKVLYVANDTGGIDLAIDPSNPNRIFAALWQRYSFGAFWTIGGSSSGIYRSLDGGTTWTKLTTGLPTVAGRIGLAIAPSNPQIVYACVINNAGTLDGMYRSGNSGDTWTKVSDASAASMFSSFSYYFSQIRVDPLNPNTIYALDVRLLRSTNGGVTYTTYANSVHVDWHDLILEPGGRWLAGTDGGFYRSSNGGTTWFKAVTLPITQLYDLGIDRRQPHRRFAGFQDNFTQRTLTGGASDWVAVIGGDGMQCEVDYTNSNKVYGEYQYGGIQRSVDGGNTWTSATSGIASTDRRNWVTPITLDPVVPSTLYTATQRIYRSTNSAVSWSAISPDLTNGLPFHDDDHGKPGVFGQTENAEDLAHLRNLISGTITVVSVSPVDNKILWAGTDDGNVWVSTDAGATYRQVNPPGTPYWVTDIEPHRFDAHAAYLSVTGYRSGNKLPYVRLTRDLGATWENISAGLPAVPVSTLLPSSEWRGRIFTGNDVGVYLSDDDGRTWSDVRGGLPYVVVIDLVENLTSRKIFAGTHGRSIYTYDLTQLPPADGDGDGVDNNADCDLRDGGAFASPAEVGPVRVDRGATEAPGDAVVVSWPSLAAQAGSATTYDVAAGSLADLAVSGTAGSAALACGLAATAVADPSALAPGEGRYYLVRARNGCGVGTWGAARTSPACP